jgi:hypothetical protein
MDCSRSNEGRLESTQGEAGYRQSLGLAFQCLECLINQTVMQPKLLPGIVTPRSECRSAIPANELLMLAQRHSVCTIKRNHRTPSPFASLQNSTESQIINFQHVLLSKLHPHHSCSDSKWDIHGLSDITNVTRSAALSCISRLAASEACRGAGYQPWGGSP